MNRSNRVLLFVVSVFFCLGLIALSVIGVTAPAEGLLAVPIQFVQNIANGIVLRTTGTVQDVVELQDQQAYVAELEGALAKKAS